ncbi:MAG: type II secretion system major pseudopilin GspG [Candidatus Polarisedimenticolaceae bacterium]|nr:type II secretion system major pseudopilin GspG [Candidatus Polarisedimenticolaceae bacterium]
MIKKKQPPTRDKKRGFTLIELLVVLVILGLLGGLVGPKVLNYLGRGKTDTAKLQIEQISAALDLYLLDVGDYPTQEQGLEALVAEQPGTSNWNGPYLRNAKLPIDPWSNSYQYAIPGDGKEFDLFSLGKDNAAGGEGENQDLSN